MRTDLIMEEDDTPNSMDKVYRKYKDAKMNPQKLMDELGIDITEGDNLGMSVVRKETDLNNDEKVFLLAVERGDAATTRHFLDESQIYFNININCVDPLGRTALHIAIENENIEMIELLLSYNVELGDALLHAINEENVEAVEMLLTHQNNNKKDLKPTTILDKIKESSAPKAPTEGGFLGGVPSSAFTPDITPIILAAHRDNYEIIKILLDRGDRIPKPHDVRCICTECTTKKQEDSLNYSRSRINAYKALASPSLISLSSKDPILTSFELSWELKRLSKLENEFKVELEGLAYKVQDFATNLLDQTRGSKELETILNHDVNGPSQGSNVMTLARLRLAIKFKQKKFVSHPNCQQLLASLWYEGLPGFRRRHIIFKVILTVTVCLMYPGLSLTYLVIPRGALGMFMRRPFIKFICHSASYMTFLFLLILSSQRIESTITFGSDDKNDTTSNRGSERGKSPTFIEWLIFVWVLGQIWREVKQLWIEGLKNYLQHNLMWNALDFLTSSLYVATYALKLVAYNRVQEEIRNNNPAAYSSRDTWHAFDPTLVAEGLFATANIFSTLKLIYIFTVNPHLGPLQITLGRMVIDIMKFGFIAILVVFSFACGVNQLYWYYAAIKADKCRECHLEYPDDPTTCENDSNCDRTLANLFDIMQSLYFAAFGLVDVKHFYLVQDHVYTEFVGKLMFGVYCAITIIVLINMLIAMLSNSYQIISNDSDKEWKFARSKLWMSYFEDGSTVPPPFNIIPSPKTFINFFFWFKSTFCMCTKQAKRSKWQSIRKLVKKVNEKEAKYQAVMRDLVKRYIMHKQRGAHNDTVTEDDLNEIKQDISAFRYELLEILSNNGMKTPNTKQLHNNKNRLRRKGSRLSLERLERRIKSVQAKQFGNGINERANSDDSMRSRLEKTNSQESSGRQKLNAADSVESSKEPPQSNGKIQSAEPTPPSPSPSNSGRTSKPYGGGIVNMAYEPLPEEVEPTKSELPLDPAKLPSIENVPPAKVFSDKDGPSKKVSFEAKAPEPENKEEVKYTYNGTNGEV